MAMTLVEQAKTEQDALRAGVIEKFASSTPVLELLPFQTIDGNAFTYNTEERLPGIAFRGINESFDESTGIINPQTESLKIMGGDADSDLFFKRTQTKVNRRAIDLRMKIKASSLYFTKIFFDGDETTYPKQISGMNKRITGNQLISAGDNGGNISHNLMQQLIDAVDGEPDVLFMSKKMRRQLTNLAESSTILSIGKDAFGRPVVMYAGIPIRIIGKDNNNNEILDFDETKGESSVTASIYAFRFGEEYVSGIQSGPLQARDLGEIDVKAAERIRIEWDIGITLMNVLSAARLYGVTAAVS